MWGFNPRVREFHNGCLKMANLQSFSKVRENIRRMRKETITAMHRFIFEYEGNRWNRQRLRKFKGFNYDDHDDGKISSICNLLQLTCKQENIQLHILQKRGVCLVQTIKKKAIMTTMKMTIVPKPKATQVTTEKENAANWRRSAMDINMI